jgi:hypothetical protein
MDGAGDMSLNRDLYMGTGATLRFPTASSGTPTLSTFGNVLVSNANIQTTGTLTGNAGGTFSGILSALSDTNPGTGTSTCLSVGSGGVNYQPASGQWTGTLQANIHMNGYDQLGMTFHDSGSRVDAITYGSGLFYIGANIGWGEPPLVMNQAHAYGYNIRSDESLKTMQGPPEGNLAAVMSLSPQTFQLDKHTGVDAFQGTEKDDNNEQITWQIADVPPPTIVGFSANEIAEAIPSASTEFFDGTLGYDTTQMLGILWGAVRELSAEVAALKEELA